MRHAIPGLALLVLLGMTPACTRRQAGAVCPCPAATGAPGQPDVARVRGIEIAPADAGPADAQVDTEDAGRPPEIEIELPSDAATGAGGEPDAGEEGDRVEEVDGGEEADAGEDVGDEEFGYLNRSTCG